MSHLFALAIGVAAGAVIATWITTAERRSDPDRDARMFRLGIEAQKDAAYLGTSKANHPAYAGGPRPAPPTLTVVDHDNTTNVIPLSRRQGPEPAA